MEKRVLVVAPTEGFIIKGLERKLEGIGLETSYSRPNEFDLILKAGNPDLIVIFTYDNMEADSDALIFIKTMCDTQGKKVISIGSTEEYVTLESYIPSHHILSRFDRPLDMDALLNVVEDYMTDEFHHDKRKNILIVDDNVTYMSMIMDWLKDYYRVSPSNSGVHALTWLATNHADLILLDYEMPITSGPQILEMIRSEASLANIPVMFLTGKSDKDSILKVLELKPVGYLLKTITKKELLDDLSRFFMSHP